jgi:hypothetical protein
MYSDGVSSSLICRIRSLSRPDWPIIVGGCPRSGTSLVRRILNAHSAIHCGPEVKFFRDFFGDYFHDPLRHLRFAASARAMLPEPDLFEITSKAFVALHERAALLAGKRRWADKNPENVLYLDQWTQILGQRWVFIHVIRNPLDTLAAIKERSFPLSIPASLDDRVGFYHKYLSAGIELARNRPSLCFRIHYERLVQSPEAGLGELMEWLGERLEAPQFDFNSFAQQTGLEDPKVAQTAKIHTESVGRWKKDLSREEAKTMWRGVRDLWKSLDPDSHYLPRSDDGWPE